MTKPRVITIGRIVHYWSYEGEAIRPNAAIVVAVSEEPGRVFLEVFTAAGFGGHDRVWAPCAPFSADGSHVPTDGHWTWPQRV